MVLAEGGADLALEQGIVRRAVHVRVRGLPIRCHVVAEFRALVRGWCLGLHCGGPGRGEEYVCRVPGEVVGVASFAGGGRGEGVRGDMLGTR